MVERHYFTTPIYYASGPPHLGHTYTTVLADCFARYYRLRGADVRFTTGMDEHGLKIVRTAAASNQSPGEFVDIMADKFQSLWDKMGISYTDFIRTTEARHRTVVIEFWHRMVAAGDIYLGAYSGLYCVECEQYYGADNLVDGSICPIHNRACDQLAEPSYFFRLSKYQQALIDYIHANPDWIFPEARRNEVLGFLTAETLQDLSVSRTSFDWGISVPEDPSHIIYVWVDALTNYVSSLGGGGSDKFADYWPTATHWIGKDILRFHAVYWPAILMACQLPLPKRLIVHGWWTIHNQKISKSSPATRVNPLTLMDDIQADGLRYLLLRSMAVGPDGDMEFEAAIQLVNAGLANTIGNLVQRFSSMTLKYLNGEINPTVAICAEPESAIESMMNQLPDTVSQAMAQWNPAAALEAIMAAGTQLNKYIEEKAPWELAKRDGSLPELAGCFLTLAQSLELVGSMLVPFVPDLARGIIQLLGGTEQWMDRLPAPRAHSIHAHPPLYPRISAAAVPEIISRWQGKA